VQTLETNSQKTGICGSKRWKHSFHCSTPVISTLPTSLSLDLSHKRTPEKFASIGSGFKS
jgi:hypothetical protein